MNDAELDAGWEPSHELIEAAAKGLTDAGLLRHDVDADELDVAIRAAVAFRTVDGHPELVPYAEVAAEREAAYLSGIAQGTKYGWNADREELVHLRSEVAALVTAARRFLAVAVNPDVDYEATRLRAALIPFTEHQEEK